MKSPPLNFQQNRFDVNFSDGIATMQKANMAKVVADGHLGNLKSTSTYEMTLADSLIVSIRLSEILYPDGTAQFLPDTIIRQNTSGLDDSLIQTAIHLLKSKPASGKTTIKQVQSYFRSVEVEGYDNLTYPSAPLRLLGLIRY